MSTTRRSGDDAAPGDRRGGEGEPARKAGRDAGPSDVAEESSRAQLGLDPLDEDADASTEEQRSPQDLAYDRVVRGDAGADLPPGPQDAMTQEIDEDERPEQADDRAARQAEQDVDRREHSADRHADPSFRRTGG